MSNVDEIKARLSIVDVVAAYVKIEPAGKNFKALSPFTNEKTPSFYVSPEKQMYYCFSSNKGGDMFTFVEELEGVDFSGALKILAEKAGVELKFEGSRAKKDERTRLYEVLERAMRMYQKRFIGNKQAFAYMRSRGISSGTLEKFRIGFAPDAWDATLSELTSRGYTPVDLERAGLIIPRKERSGHYDRFRNRIMFPVSDTAGRVIGFSGRIFEPEQEKESESNAPTSQKEDPARPQAKYINTPETDLYHKSNVLYGFDLAKTAMRKENRAILVEGQMDVLAFHEVGVEHVMAVSGTSLTEEHLKLILRFTKNLTLALDADTAGQNAADRSAKMALALGMNVSAIPIAGGKDPGDLVASAPEELKTLAGGAIGYIDHRIEGLLSSVSEEELPEKLRAVIFPHIVAIRGEMKKDAVLQKLSAALALSADAIREEYNVWLGKEGRKYTDPGSDGSSTHQEAPAQASQTGSIFAGTARSHVISRQLLGILLWQESLGKPDLSVEKFREAFLSFLSQGEKEILEDLPEEEKTQLIFETEISYGESEHLQRDADELLQNLEIESINRELNALLREIHRRSEDESEKSSEELQEKIQDLIKKKEILRERGVGPS